MNEEATVWKAERATVKVREQERDREKTMWKYSRNVLIERKLLFMAAQKKSEQGFE